MKNRSILLATLLALLTAQPGRAQVPAQLNYQGRVTVSGVNFTGTGQFKFALVDGGVNQNQTATANATVGAGQVTQIFVFSHGSGYTSAPVVTITGDGAGATATATLGLGMGTGTGPTDSVNTITINNPGSGYTTATVTIAPPPPNVLVTTYWSNDGTSIGGSAPASAVPLAVTSGLYSLALGDTALAHMTTAFPASVFDNPDVRLRVWFDDGTNGSQLLAPDQRFATVPYAFRAALAQSVPAGSITSAQLADGAVTGVKIGSGAIGNAQIASGALTPGQLFTSSSPQSGQVLGFDGTKFNWIANAGGGAVFPFDNMSSYLTEGAVLGLRNDYGDGIHGETNAIAKSGIYGVNNVAQTIFNQPAGQGVYGYGAHLAVGVLGVSEDNDGVSGRTNRNGKSGVFGYTTNIAYGVAGISEGGAGVYAQTNAANQNAVYGYTGASNSTGVKGASALHDGVVGVTSAAGKSGVVGFASLSDNNAVAAINNAGTGLFAQTNGLGATAGFFWNTAGGDAIRADGNLLVHGTATVRVLTINNGIDVAEPFMIRNDAEFPRGSVMVISDERPGELQLSGQPYDTRVAGIISGANGINPGLQLTQKGFNDEGGQPVALTGRVYCRADASFGAIKPGDLLTTSANPGHAMKVTQHDRAQGAVLGKAMSALDEGTGYVLVLVTLQ